MNQLHIFLCKEITYARIILEDYVNKKQILMLNYKVGAYIFVDVKNLWSERLSKKLDFKSYGLYLINNIISPYVYRLLLLLDTNAHLISHVNKLRLAPDNPLLGQQLPPLPPLRFGNIIEK